MKGSSGLLRKIPEGNNNNQGEHLFVPSNWLRSWWGLLNEINSLFYIMKQEEDPTSLKGGHNKFS